MRAALISLAGQPRLGPAGAPLTIAGKSVARRQLDFALAAGCDRVVVLGDGASPEAIALRHVSEAAGARFSVIGGAHGLLGAVGARDELLVLAPGLVPEEPLAIEAFKQGAGILILPAQAASSFGFERIDLERAWGGALLAHGASVERLAELPPDTEAAPAMLRIALQARLPERRLPDTALSGGSWAMVRQADDSPTRDRDWFARHAAAHPRQGPTARLGRFIVTRFAARLLGAARSDAGLLAAAGALVAAAVAAAALGWAAAGFVLAAFGWLAGAVAADTRALRRAPFGRVEKRREWLLGLVFDAALAACAVLAIEGDWLHRLFPPLVLIAALHAGSPAATGRFAGVADDRALLALLLALAAAAGMAEPATMALALATLALAAARRAAKRG